MTPLPSEPDRLHRTEENIRKTSIWKLVTQVGTSPLSINVLCWVWRKRWQMDRRDKREVQRTWGWRSARGGKRCFEQGWTKITPWRPIMKEMGYEREASSTMRARRGVRDCNQRWILAPIQKLGQRPSTNTDTQTLIQPPVNAVSDLPFPLT